MVDKIIAIRNKKTHFAINTVQNSVPLSGQAHVKGFCCRQLISQDVSWHDRHRQLVGPGVDFI